MGERREPVGTARGDHDLRATTGEPAGRRLTDASRSAGDDDDLAGEGGHDSAIDRIKHMNRILRGFALSPVYPARMLRSLSRLAWFCLGFAGLGVLRADVTLAPLFQDHAVLQCDQPVPVWGWADPGEVVLVSFRGQHQRVTTSADGRWLARLAPLAASTGSAELVITGKNTVRVADVLVGEVWLCSGQSNMEFPVYDPTSRIFHLDQARTEVAAANFPLIRQYKVARAVAEKPADTGRGNWAVCSPETVGTFTAVGYFFARDLHRTLGVPIGIINSSWGGTPVESWMSAEALASDPAFHVVDERWQQMLADYPAKKIIAGEALAAWRQAEAAAKAAGAGAHAAFLKQNHPPRMPRGPGDFMDAPRPVQRHDRAAGARGLPRRALVSGREQRRAGGRVSRAVRRPD